MIHRYSSSHLRPSATATSTRHLGNRYTKPTTNLLHPNRLIHNHNHYHPSNKAHTTNNTAAACGAENRAFTNDSLHHLLALEGDCCSRKKSESDSVGGSGSVGGVGSECQMEHRHKVRPVQLFAPSSSNPNTLRLNKSALNAVLGHPAIANRKVRVYPLIGYNPKSCSSDRCDQCVGSESQREKLPVELLPRIPLHFAVLTEGGSTPLSIPLSIRKS